jgi:ATP-binding cassette subfamily B (MDR/TAP) protein 1
MRRPTLAVDTNQPLPTSVYELTQSPRSSVYSESVKHPEPEASIPPDLHSKAPSSPAGPSPSIQLLFSLLSRRHRVLFLVPAIISSVLSGAVAPFMTIVIGRSFDAFAQFPLADPTDADKARLLHNVGIAALQLVGLAGAALALSSITSSLWIWTGEHNVMALRKLVYTAVTSKDMEWFDTNLGADGGLQTAAQGETGPLGAGGLMAKFAR